MDILAKIKNFLEKARGWPEQKKKIVLWTIVGVLAVVMGFFWIRGAVNNFSKIGESIGNIELPKMDTSGMPTLPSLDILNTENWQTYVNSEYGYQMTYPKGWFVDSLNPSDVYISPEPPEDKVAFSAEAMQIAVTNIGDDSSLQKEVSNRLEKIGVDFTEKNMEIGGQSGLMIVTICEGVGCGSPEWAVVKNGNLYYFTLGLDSSKQGPIFNQMLSTFKFAK